MMRGSSAAVIRPNVAAEFTVVLGLLKLTVLNRLKNSARNCRLTLFEKVNRLNSPRSTVERFGPKNSPLQRLAERPVRVDGKCGRVEPDLARCRASEGRRRLERLAGSNCPIVP